jgi:hypothetical protein
MMNARVADDAASAMAASRDDAMSTSGCGGTLNVALTTMFRRPGSGLPIDSYVFRPMMIG